MNPSERRGVGLFHIFLLMVAVFVLVPFVWIVAAGFKTQISLLQGEIFFTPSLNSLSQSSRNLR